MEPEGQQDKQDESVVKSENSTFSSQQRPPPLSAADRRFLEEQFPYGTEKLPKGMLRSQSLGSQNLPKPQQSHQSATETSLTASPAVIKSNDTEILQPAEQSHISSLPDSQRRSKSLSGPTAQQFQPVENFGAFGNLQPTEQSQLSKVNNSQESSKSLSGPTVQQFRPMENIGTFGNWQPAEQSMISNVHVSQAGTCSIGQPTYEHSQNEGTSRTFKHTSNVEFATYGSLSQGTDYSAPQIDSRHHIEGSPSALQDTKQCQIKKRSASTKGGDPLGRPAKKPKFQLDPLLRENTTLSSSSDSDEPLINQINTEASSSKGNDASVWATLKKLARNKDLAVTPPVDPDNIKAEQAPVQPPSSPVSTNWKSTKKNDPASSKKSTSKRPPKPHQIDVDPDKPVAEATLRDTPNDLVKKLWHQMGCVEWRNKQGSEIKVPERMKLVKLAKEDDAECLFNRRGYIKPSFLEFLNKFSYKGLSVDATHKMNPKLWEYLSRAVHENHLQDPTHYCSKGGKPRIRQPPAITPAREADGTFKSAPRDDTRAFDISYVSEKQLLINMKIMCDAYVKKVHGDTSQARRFGADQQKQVTTFNNIVDHFVRIANESQTIANTHAHLMKEHNRIVGDWERIHEDTKDWVAAVRYAVANGEQIPKEPKFKLPTGIVIPREHRQYYKKAKEISGITVKEDPNNDGIEDEEEDSDSSME